MLSLLRDNNNTVVGVLAVIRDITDRKRVEEALRQSEERFSKIFHANPLPVGLTTLAEGRYLDVNDSFLHLVGYRREEVIGHTSILGLWADPEARTRMVQELGAGQSVHELALDLRPAMLDDMGLIPALLWRCERYTAQTQVKVNFAHTGMATRFPPEVETAAYRIVQEALTNVTLHAGVNEATVRLWTDQNQLVVEIQDQGNGFDPDAALAAGATSGLAGMRERALLLGGQFTVESASGNGTRVTAKLPLITEQGSGGAEER